MNFWLSWVLKPWIKINSSCTARCFISLFLILLCLLLKSNSQRCQSLIFHPEGICILETFWINIWNVNVRFFGRSWSMKCGSLEEMRNCQLEVSWSQVTRERSLINRKQIWGRCIFPEFGNHVILGTIYFLICKATIWPAGDLSLCLC